jgi:glycosyltransferase involved in cell wall biosynthesis
LKRFVLVFVFLFAEVYMPTVAYIANEFPTPVEPYVVEEIEELRRRGVNVIPCSARRAKVELLDEPSRALAAETVCLQPLRWMLLLRAAYLCFQRWSLISGLVKRVLLQGKESPSRRVRALLHTWLGACYALRLEGRGVEHIHVHHGYFASWIAMVAARLLGVTYSMTLHGSDLLLHAAYLDVKLKHCRFCFTVSAYNRRHILEHYADIPVDRVIVQRMGVDPLRWIFPPSRAEGSSGCQVILAVGRLHAVKDHAFLVRCCWELKRRGLEFLCLIAGEGPERPSLERLIEQLQLTREVKLLGHVQRNDLDAYYAMADLVILTSRSEGIPLVLMEAMAHEKVVLAPSITGIPELVVQGKTGFLYQPSNPMDFVARVLAICARGNSLEPVRRGARQHVLEHFNREKNLHSLGEMFLARIESGMEGHCDESAVLQQI